MVKSCVYETTLIWLAQNLDNIRDGVQGKGTLRREEDSSVEKNVNVTRFWHLRSQDQGKTVNTLNNEIYSVN